MLKMIISGVVLAGLVLGGMTMVCKKWIFIFQQKNSNKKGIR